MERVFEPNFVLLDAARMLDNMAIAKEMNPAFTFLYQGREEKTLSLTGPYIFPYKAGDEFSNWLKQFGWGKSWGVFIESRIEQQKLAEHFRQFIKMKLEDGQEIYFRFYDPRVLRVFLPTCDSLQLTQFFGPVHSFMLEDEDPNKALAFSLERDQTGFARLRISSATVKMEMAQ